MKRLKKLIAIVMGVAIASYVTKLVLSADNATVDVVMTLQTVDVTLVGSTSILVSAALSSSRVSPRAVFRNNGPANEDYSVKISSTAGSWTNVATAPGGDQYRLSALWHEYNTLASTGTAEFGTNDILTGSFQLSSDTIFFNDTETHATAGVKGFNVPPYAGSVERNVFFKFDAPSSTSTANTATAHVTVSASLTP